jgi:2-polyprenyl-3-methyl-5-hydroxy-6-metoxy-1,4-benzoquinol methylase
MTWEETIRHIRSNDEYKDLVKEAYLEADLQLNVERFSGSVEFSETLKLIDRHLTGVLTILDVGCGNGIASVSFARRGHNVMAIDPDPSETVGTGAVRKLKDELKLSNLEVVTSTAEDLKLNDQSFDLVYCRQAMHHANDLPLFIRNITRYLRKGGLLLTIRDHVVYNTEDKMKFLAGHPLQKFYHGENAFRREDYLKAFTEANLIPEIELKFFDSEINYFPLKMAEVKARAQEEEQTIKSKLRDKLGFLADFMPAYFLYKSFIFDPQSMTHEKFFPGRMYSFLSIKQ